MNKPNSAILQRWKRTMHVPLRLDVYYQHPPPSSSKNNPNPNRGERELLERWCLEYAPTTTTRAVDPNGNNNEYFVEDPIVQLRQVCKQIVVWLRVLYCHARLLPAQALRRKTNDNITMMNSNAIGFSIYVVGDGQDDVSGLVQQGFVAEPSTTMGGVPTPYGVLAWKVYLAPKALITKLVHGEQEKSMQAQKQRQNAYANIAVVSRSMAIPTPTAPTPTTGPSRPQQRTATGYASPPPTRTARSAPSSATTHPRDSTLDLLQQQQHSPRYYSRSPNSFRSNTNNNNTNNDNTTIHTGSRSHIENNGIDIRTPTRRNSHRAVVDERRSPGGVGVTSRTTNTTAHNEPGNNLSALSLALMAMKTTEGGNNHNNGNNDNNFSGGTTTTSTRNHPPPQLGATSSVTTSTSSGGSRTAAEAIAAVEQRRAALHQAPPSAATASFTSHEYGYAYNSNGTATPATRTTATSGIRIPQTNTYNSSHNSTTTGSMNSNSNNPFYSGSASPNFRPSSLISSTSYGTTPTGYLVSGTPSKSPSLGFVRDPAIPQSGNVGGSSNAAAASNHQPPFVRPLGFVNNQQQQQQQRDSIYGGALTITTPPSKAALAAPAALGGTITSTTTATTNAHGLANTASLDLLHSSPFSNKTTTSVSVKPVLLRQQEGGETDGGIPSAALWRSEERARSITAATTFINDFYQHHYDMSASGSAGGGGGGCFGGGGFLPADDRQHPFYHSSSVAMLDRAFFDDDDDDENDENFPLNANDMPFAVDGMNHTAYIFPKNDTNSLHPPACSEGGATTGDASSSVYSIRNEASLVASMCSAAPKRLQMFDKKMTTKNNHHNQDPVFSPHDDSATDRSGGSDTAVAVSMPGVESFTDELADFKSFGASLMTSTTSGIVQSESLQASAGSG